MSKPEVKLGLYRHYKGKNYEVTAVAFHSDTMEEFVVYKALYEGKLPFGQLFVKPVKDFLIDIEIDGKRVPRFRYIGR